jgi:mannosyltransferase OCH1-like enzyme
MIEHSPPIIPKKIHYCWLSGEPLPEKLLKCMETWQQVLPGYELIRWDAKRFDITSVKFVEEACNKKKWAFASDYIRLHALFTEGGIYLDTDVYLLKSLDAFLKHDFFTAVEIDHEAIRIYNTMELLNKDGTPKYPDCFIKGIQMQAAIMGSVKGHPYLYDCMNYYHDQHFILEDGSIQNKIIAPHIYAKVAVSYGFVYIDKRQELRENMVVYPSETFAGHLHTANHKAYAIHMCAGSWRDNEKSGVFEKTWKFMRSNSILRRIFGKGAIVVNSFSYKINRSGKVSYRILSLYRQFLWERNVGYLDPGVYTCHWLDYDIPDGKYICHLMLDDKRLKEYVLIKESVS